MPPATLTRRFTGTRRGPVLLGPVLLGLAGLVSAGCGSSGGSASAPTAAATAAPSTTAPVSGSAAAAAPSTAAPATPVSSSPTAPGASSAPAGGGGAPVDGGPCRTAGERTGGGPGITLECRAGSGGTVWVRLTDTGGGSGGGGQTGGPGGSSCASLGSGLAGEVPSDLRAWLASRTVSFAVSPFDLSALSIITNGIDTNDPRFSYQWLARADRPATIVAPADGVFVRVRFKERRPGIFDSEDFDRFFIADCSTTYRYNHITDPRPDLRASYRGGTKASQEFLPDGSSREDFELQVPLTFTQVKAGEVLGTTRGTPKANNFDFQVSRNGQIVCPFSVFEEPVRSALLAKLGPKSAAPAGPPQPGHPCEGYSGKP